VVISVVGHHPRGVGDPGGARCPGHGVGERCCPAAWGVLARDPTRGVVVRRRGLQQWAGLGRHPPRQVIPVAPDLAPRVGDLVEVPAPVIVIQQSAALGTGHLGDRAIRVAGQDQGPAVTSRDGQRRRRPHQGGRLPVAVSDRGQPTGRVVLIGAPVARNIGVHAGAGVADQGRERVRRGRERAVRVRGDRRLRTSRVHDQGRVARDDMTVPRGGPATTKQPRRPRPQGRIRAGRLDREPTRQGQVADRGPQLTGRTVHRIHARALIRGRVRVATTSPRQRVRRPVPVRQRRRCSRDGAVLVPHQLTRERQSAPRSQGCGQPMTPHVTIAVVDPCPRNTTNVGDRVQPVHARHLPRHRVIDRPHRIRAVPIRALPGDVHRVDRVRHRVAVLHRDISDPAVRGRVVGIHLREPDTRSSGIDDRRRRDPRLRAAHQRVGQRNGRIRLEGHVRHVHPIHDSADLQERPAVPEVVRVPRINTQTRRRRRALHRGGIHP